MNNSTQPILVLGATGKTGSRIVQRLTDRGVPVRLGSRAEEIPFDWQDDSTWAQLLAGTRAVYVAYQPDLAIPEARAHIQKLVDLAVAAGVERLVLLSGRGEEEAEQCEQIVQQAPLSWTILRCSFFAQNFSEGLFLESVLAGALMLPVNDTVQEPFIDIDDVADVAVAALTENGHAGQIYELTGADLLTFAEAVAIIGQAAAREVHFIAVPMDDYKAGMKAANYPDDFIWLAEYLFNILMDGRNAHLTDGVQRALGRAPRGFADYARTAAQSGVWQAQEA